MKMLIQFPTKGRRDKFFSTLDLYYSLANDIDNCIFHVVIDHFDYRMNNSNTLDKLTSYNNLDVSIIQEDPTKIKACNYNISIFTDFDIVVLASDDMIPQVKGWDDIIRNDMLKYYPNIDGCLWYFDGNQNRVCTLSILGINYFNSFGYIYYPEYQTMWCDDEFTMVAQNLRKIEYIDNCIIKHEHPAFDTSIEKDETYLENDVMQGEDSVLFNKRRLSNFKLLQDA